ncbi:MAG: hypothetical protein R6V58_02645 [Planctomycetota bacterium]
MKRLWIPLVLGALVCAAGCTGEPGWRAPDEIVAMLGADGTVQIDGETIAPAPRGRSLDGTVPSRLIAGALVRAVQERDKGAGKEGETATTDHPFPEPTDRFTVHIRFEDVRKNTWEQAACILEGAARAELAKLRIADIPVELPKDQWRGSVPDRADRERSAPPWLPLKVETDADLAEIRKHAAELARRCVILEGDATAPMAQMLKVIRLLDEAGAAYLFTVLKRQPPRGEPGAAIRVEHSSRWPDEPPVPPLRHLD